MFNPTTLLEPFGLTKIQEEHVIMRRRNYRSSTMNFNSSNTQKIEVTTENQATSSAQKAFVLVQIISPLQMEERREKKRLCYNCYSKWSLGHRCVAPKLFIIESVEIVDTEILVDSMLAVECPEEDLMELCYSGANLEISYMLADSLFGGGEGGAPNGSECFLLT
jgi:hypothetical protein